jgi:hypothetical protein
MYESFDALARGDDAEASSLSSSGSTKRLSRTRSHKRTANDTNINTNYDNNNKSSNDGSMESLERCDNASPKRFRQSSFESLASSSPASLSLSSTPISSLLRYNMSLIMESSMIGTNGCHIASSLVKHHIASVGDSVTSSSPSPTSTVGGVVVAAAPASSEHKHKQLDEYNLTLAAHLSGMHEPSSLIHHTSWLHIVRASSSSSSSSSKQQQHLLDIHRQLLVALS